MTDALQSNPTFENPYRPLWLRGINWTGETLRCGGIPLLKLSEQSLLSAATSETGLSDWGDESFRLPLRILLESLEKDANLNFLVAILSTRRAFNC